jgi:cyclase
MLAKRIITTLMLNNGVLFRSKNFIPDYRFTLNFIDMWSVDEIILLDITRELDFESEKKNIFFCEMEKISKNSYVPLTVGGGIKKLKHIEKLLKNGADKIILNTISINNPNFINEAAKEFGSQCIVISVDAKYENEKFFLMEKYGQTKSSHELVNYIKLIQEKNAGEIFLQSINCDGSLLGYDLNLLETVKNHLNIPLIISCGAGNWSHVKNVLEKNYVSAASLTNVFHFTEKSIKNLKQDLKNSIFIRE